MITTDRVHQLIEQSAYRTIKFVRYATVNKTVDQLCHFTTGLITASMCRRWNTSPRQPNRRYKLDCLRADSIDGTLILWDFGHSVDLVAATVSKCVTSKNYETSKHKWATLVIINVCTLDGGFWVAEYDEWSHHDGIWVAIVPPLTLHTTRYR